MNKLLASILLLLLVWSGFLWALSISDEERLSPESGPISQAPASASPRTVESHPGAQIRSWPAVQVKSPASGAWQQRVAGTESTHHETVREEPQDQEAEVPGAFPPDEQYWNDELPEEAGLEPIAAQPMPLRPEPLDNPWGGEWGDQGGGG